MMTTGHGACSEQYELELPINILCTVPRPREPKTSKSGRFSLASLQMTSFGSPSLNQASQSTCHLSKPNPVRMSPTHLIKHKSSSSHKTKSPVILRNKNTHFVSLLYIPLFYISKCSIVIIPFTEYVYHYLNEIIQ
jgi:hypothetical protein